MRYDLDYASAEKAYKALDEASATQVALAFQKALARKLGILTTPVPEFDAEDSKVPMGTRFERFFDGLFDVAPKDIDTPLSLEEFKQRCIEARDAINETADECAKSSKDKDMEPMYREDASNYDLMVTYLDAGNMKDAIRSYWNQDTAARDWLFMGPDEVRNRRTNLLLMAHDRDGNPEE